MNSKCLFFSVGKFVAIVVLLGLFPNVAGAAEPSRQRTGAQRAGANVKTWAKFGELPVGSIRPDGWLLRGLELQRDGLMGHLEEIGFPFDSDAWQGRDPIGPDPRVARRHRGWTERWNWHITANWLEATLRNGYLLDDETLIEKVRKRINYNLHHQTPDGAMGPRYLNGTDQVVRPAPTEFLHLLTIKIVAYRLGCSPANVYAIIDRGLLPVIRIGPSKGLRVEEADLEQFIQDRKTKNTGARPRSLRPRLKHIKL